MRRVLLALAVLALCAPAAEKKKSAKPPDVQVVETKAVRDDGKIALDGRIRNIGEKTIEGLVLFFDFRATGQSVVTRQKTAIEETSLEPGQEAEYRVELRDPVRAVEFVVSGAQDNKKRDLDVGNSGPFPIE